MITKQELANKVPKELMKPARSLMERLPILVDNFEVVESKRVALFDEKSILNKLKIYKCRKYTKAQRAKDEMIKYLEGLYEIPS